MARKFRVGIIGAGGIARGVHLPGWKAIPDVEIVAVADINEAQAELVAKEAGNAQAFKDYRD